MKFNDWTDPWNLTKTFNLLSAFNYDAEVLGTVISIDLIIYGPLAHIDMYLDNVRFDYYTRDRSWVPGANLRQGSTFQSFFQCKEGATYVIFVLFWNIPMIPHYRIEEFRTHPVEIEIQNLGMLKIIFSTYKTSIKKVTTINW